MKTCCKCKKEQPNENFGKLKSSKDGLRYDCKDCRKEYRNLNKEHIKTKNKTYYEMNKDNLLDKNRKYREDNIVSINAQRMEYRANNKERIKMRNKEYLPKRKQQIKVRRQVDKGFQLKELLKTRMHKALKSNYQSKTVETYINCNVKCLKQWLEFQFDDKMNWGNLGTYWEVDHILPIARFDLNKKSEQDICFNWTNLQPLFKTENKFKSKKIIPHYYFNSIVSIHRFIQKTNSNSQGYQSINKSLCWLREKLGYGKNPNE
jgi:hypothetical protein